MTDNCQHCGEVLPGKPHIYVLAEKALTLFFLGVVLKLFAQHFDETEIWAIIVYATGGGVYIAGKKYLPAAVQFIKKGMATDG
jgi:hypothetical protein